MAATREDISRWFDAGVERGASHMIVCCDTFDWDDYPSYVMPDEDPTTAVDQKAAQSMVKIMEVYKLSEDKDAQMAEHRAFHL